MNELIRDFGFPIAMSVGLFSAFIWLTKMMQEHFKQQIISATEERKQLTDTFATTINNHINHNTAALNESLTALKEMRCEHNRILDGLETLKNK